MPDTQQLPDAHHKNYINEEEKSPMIVGPDREGDLRRRGHGLGSPRSVVPTPPRSLFDHNKYATGKSFGQGFFNFALLSANASALRNILFDKDNPFYYVVVICLCLSITMQVKWLTNV